MSGETRIEKILNAFIEGRKRPVRVERDFAAGVMSSIHSWENEKEKEEGKRSTPRPGRLSRTGIPFLSRAWPDFRLRPGLALAFSALMFISVSGLVYFAARQPLEIPAQDTTRIKGDGFRLGFLLKRAGEVRPALRGGKYLPGDLLQAVYSAPVQGRIHLFSIDGAGIADCYSCNARDSVFPPGQDRPLSYALELDASPGREIFVGFWSERALPSTSLMESLLAAWKAVGPDPVKFEEALRSRLPAGCEASVFPILKKEIPIHETH